MRFKLWLEANREELEKLPIETLDKMAFGFSSGSILKLHPKQVTIIYTADLRDAEYAMNNSGKSPQEWANQISLKEPIDIKLQNGKFVLDDGHHRYLAAKILNKELLCKVEIKDNPINVILNLTRKAQDNAELSNGF